MKRESKSALFRRDGTCFFVLIPLLFSLAGCADTPWPGWLTGEPDRAALAQGRAVATPPGQTQEGWPNLADVPMTKPVFTPVLTRRAETERLSSDNHQAQAESARVQAIDVPEPLSAAPLQEPAPALQSPLTPLAPFSALRGGGGL